MLLELNLISDDIVHEPVLTPQKAKREPLSDLLTETWILQEWKAGAQEGKRYLLDVDKNRKPGSKSTLLTAFCPTTTSSFSREGMLGDLRSFWVLPKQIKPTLCAKFECSQ